MRQLPIIHFPEDPAHSPHLPLISHPFKHTHTQVKEGSRSVILFGTSLANYPAWRPTLDSLTRDLVSKTQDGKCEI